MKQLAMLLAILTGIAAIFLAALGLMTFLFGYTTAIAIFTEG